MRLEQREQRDNRDAVQKCTDVKNMKGRIKFNKGRRRKVRKCKQTERIKIKKERSHLL